MGSSQLQFFVLALFLFNTIHANKVCDFADDACMTKAANYNYKNILAEFKGESPDPIHQDLIEQEVGTFKYKLGNINLTGMKNCEVSKLTCRPNEKTFDYYLHCPQLVLNSDFETGGSLGSVTTEAKGDAKITIDDCVVIWKGEYGRLISDDDQKPRILIKSFNVDIEPKSKVTYEVVKLTSGDKAEVDKALKFLNENWVEMEKSFRPVMLAGLFKRFFENFSEALKAFPVEKLLPTDLN